MGNLISINQSTGANSEKVVQIGKEQNPLAAIAVFASSGFDVRDADSVVATVLADQSGMLFIEFSWDNTNFTASASYAYTANDPLGISLSVVAKYARIRFVNGGTAQTSMLLEWGKKK
ncbi:hypothetical protein [Candidatus Uabimicrobium amorphum]|uniref:Uncharacterized protein n=1 Tax=Uabimicrobium amorphum TaxID=2596890 RepID=A0A5S9IM45_UABAM|nr:hypothetical protein [Candidatus Uabimicrobium amorphum]BBM84433.1 hypothetical protein UABAM_02793 [Candidatus Uabimicrobium amorphum]